MISIEIQDNYNYYMNLFFQYKYYPFLNLKNKLNYHIPNISIHLNNLIYHINIQHKI